MRTSFSIIFIISLFLITFPSALSIDYDPGPGGETLLKPIQQGDRPWALGSYGDIDDPFRDDSDFIQSAPLGKSGQDLVDFKFNSGFDAHQDYDHVLRIVFKEGNIGTNNLHLTLTLKQGDQIIEDWTYYPISSAFTLDEHTISPVNAAKISDYSNLWITIRAWCDLTCTSTPGSKDVIQISWLDFSYHKTRSDETNLLPSLVGIGIYQIETQNVTKPYSENMMKDNDAGIFSTYHPYSKFSDETDILRYGQINDYEKFGTFFFVSDNKRFFPITSGMVDRPVQIQILIHDDFQSERVQHVELSGIMTKQDSKKNAHLFEVDLEKGKNTVVHDDYDVLKDVFTSWSVEDGYLWANIDLVFKKILPKSDFVVQIWDQERITKKYELFEIFEVLKTDELIMDKEISLISNVMIIHDASSPICKISSQCFMPFNAQILETGIVTWTNYDETVHSVIGGSDAPNNRFSYYVFPGKSVQHRFDIPGEYDYYCDLHPWAKGKVTVINSSNKVPTVEKTNLSPIILYSITSSGSLLVENDDLVIKHNRNMWFEVTGNLFETPGKNRVELIIISPDDSKKIIHSSVNDRGYYRVPVLLNERWMPGEYTIISKAGSTEVGKVTFTVKDDIK